MLRLIADIEADGFLDEVTKIHCIVTKSIDTGQVYQFYGDTTVHGHHGSIEAGIDYMFSADVLIGHYFVGYDLPVIKKLHNKEYTGQLFDSLVLSRTLNPERKLPHGCPTHIKNPVTGKKEPVGPHSIAAWGYRVGRGKPGHYDWKTFSPEMLHRCTEDVEINHLALLEMFDELSVSVDTPYQDLPNYVRYEQRVAVIMKRQEETGWLVDVPLLRTHIATLQDMIAGLEAELEDRLPFIAKPLESNIKKIADIQAYLDKNVGPGTQISDTTRVDGLRRWVVKPFMKSGKLNSHALKYWAHELTHNGGRWQVGGPYCRVEFRKISLTSDNEVKAYLLTQGWQPDEYNFSKKTGKVTSPKFTESSLDSIKGDTGQLIAKHMKASQRLSTMAGWLAHIGDDSRLHGEVNPQACPTVRMTHKILVNVPSPEKQSFFAEQMREIFIAPKGYKVVSADIASCQLRALCHYMGDENFTYAVVHGNKDEGTDLHTLNMKMAGLPTRGHAKNFIYAFLFGAGPTKIGRMVGGGVNEGKRIIAKYLENVPKLKALKEGLEATWKSRGYLIGVDGRKIYIHSKKDLLVYMLQSIEAMIIKIAVCLVDHWITQEGLDARQVCVYHDEFSFEAREDHADRVAFLLEEAIKQAGETLKLNPPAAGEAAVGDNWLEVH